MILFLHPAFVWLSYLYLFIFSVVFSSSSPLLSSILYLSLFAVDFPHYVRLERLRVGGGFGAIQCLSPALCPPPPHPHPPAVP